ESFRLEPRGRAADSPIPIGADGHERTEPLERPRADARNPIELLDVAERSATFTKTNDVARAHLAHPRNAPPRGPSRRVHVDPERNGRGRRRRALRRPTERREEAERERSDQEEGRPGASPRLQLSAGACSRRDGARSSLRDGSHGRGLATGRSV